MCICGHTLHEATCPVEGCVCSQPLALCPTCGHGIRETPCSTIFRRPFHPHDGQRCGCTHDA